ncbi:MAG TPA: 1,4-alpha-glucan branching protein GlgB [Clostridiales bacterium]|nr:1,4-alpha-glucan branching protein GlgB [Clostridiales bacterium]
MTQKTISTPDLSEFLMYLFHEGTNYQAYEMLGSIYIPATKKQDEGFRFAVWAPNASDVSLVGDFNNWQTGKHPMARVNDSGIWQIFVPSMKEGQLYKYAVTTQQGEVTMRTDPYAFYNEFRPNSASITCRIDKYIWNNEVEIRDVKQKSYESPMVIYEIHAGSWKRHEDGSFMNYRELAKELIPYVADMGYTHIELMPIQEYPYDGSWGYQVTGYYAATSRYGSPEDLMFFIDSCHGAGLKVIMDWVPAHFPKDTHALARFDGTCLYEYEDPRLGEHSHWGTLVFDYGKPEVQSFLISNAMFWLKVYRFDGIRVDAVSSMIYLDYGRDDGQWIANKHGGNENLEAIALIQNLNKVVFAEFPDALMIAEESTAFPKVTMPIHEGGLGFNYKWNMGWMHDSLRYFSMDPIYRKGNHNLLTFLLVYAFSENFILPLSHDEVVHGKKSLLDKMYGSYEEKFATLKAFYGYMMALPGKKLMFMGGEFGQFIEWNFDSQLDWHLLEYDSHRQLRDYVKELNHVYKENRSLWQLDTSWEGFEWIEANDADNSVISFIRKGKEKEEYLVIVCNFTPVRRVNYSLRVPIPGEYIEVLSSNREEYGGIQKEEMVYVSDNFKGIEDGEESVIYATLPPLSTVYLRKSKKV